MNMEKSAVIQSLSCSQEVFLNVSEEKNFFPPVQMIQRRSDIDAAVYGLLTTETSGGFNRVVKV